MQLGTNLKEAIGSSMKRIPFTETGADINDRYKTILITAMRNTSRINVEPFHEGWTIPATTKLRIQTPGLIASPQAAASDSNSDLPTRTNNNARYMELVAQKRAERKAREKEGREKGAREMEEREMEQRILKAREKLRLSRTAETDSEDETAGKKAWEDDPLPVEADSDEDCNDKDDASSVETDSGVDPDNDGRPKLDERSDSCAKHGDICFNMRESVRRA
ncbi:hypothetical protein H2199_008977 [Coniosporium tulheliwenetii]|uniref:Uncharacterized protein n=1 Tax=Coniosporium tulheliwenetii TaxID=3383036 RepID=A0ACC2YGS6_9PEZI|nr:hypothetical protein H2199_008977 [Cladosporium sp. JES 115]